MNLIETKIGEYRLLIESQEGEIVNKLPKDRSTIKTGNITEGKYDKLISEAKGMIKQIANEFSNELMSIQPHPDEVEFEFGISLSTEMAVWILKANGDSNFKVKMKWIKTE